MNKIEEMRKRIQERNAKGNTKKKSGSGDMFPFWNMDIDQASKVRLIADSNPDNPDAFFVTKMEHKLHIDGKTRTVICRQTFGEKCPICELSQKYYKTEGKGSANGKYYWRDKTHIARVLVLETPLTPEKDDDGNGPETYVGGVFKTQFGYQLMQKIDEQLLSTEDPLDSLPWDIENGYDFIIKKSKQGEHGNYQVGSRFARAPSPVPSKYLDAITPLDLSTYLPEDPGYDAVQAILNQHLASRAAGSDEGESDDETPAGSVAQRIAARMNAAKNESKAESKPEPQPEPPSEDSQEASSPAEDEEDELAKIKAILAKTRGNK